MLRINFVIINFEIIKNVTDPHIYGTEAAQFLFWEYINEISVALCTSVCLIVVFVLSAILSVCNLPENPVYIQYMRVATDRHTMIFGEVG